MKRMQQLAVRMLVTSGLMAFPLAAVAEEVTCKTAGTIIVGITRSLVQDAVHFWGRDNAALQAMMDRGHVLFVKEGAELAVTIDEFDPGNPYKQVRRPGTPDRFWAFGTRQDYGCEKPQPVEPSPPTTAPAKPSPPKPAPKQTKPKGFPPPDTPTQPVQEARVFRQCTQAALVTLGIWDGPVDGEDSPQWTKIWEHYLDSHRETSHDHRQATIRTIINQDLAAKRKQISWERCGSQPTPTR